MHTEKCPVCFSGNLRKCFVVRDHSISKEEFLIVECPECHLKITQDVPGPSEIGRYYKSEDYISHSDTSRGLVNRLYHLVRDYMLRRKKHIVQGASGMRSGALLDYGCGTGYFLHTMQRGGWDVTGMEPDPEARKFASSKFGLNIDGPESLSRIDDATFDVITLWHVLEHVHDLRATVGLLTRKLKPSGTLIIAVPNHQSLDAAHYGATWAAWDVPRHIWHFSPASMDRLIKSCGLRATKKIGMPFDAFYVSLLSEKYRGNTLGLLAGGITGLRSNLGALMDAKRASSIIYLFHKG